MGKVCPHCGMESDHDKVCSWCHKDLQEPAPAQAEPKPGPSPVASATRAAVAAAAERRSGPGWLYPAIGVGALALLVLALQLVFSVKAMRPPGEVASWRSVQSNTGHFQLQVPDTWQYVTAGSEGTFEWVRVKFGSLYVITIEGTSGKGAFSDIASAAARVSAGNSQGTPPLERSAAGKLHQTLGTLAQKEDRSYHEEGQMQACNFAGLPAAYSVYTAKRRVGLSKATAKGWRVSCPGTDYGYDIRAEAPEKHWDQFQPIASRVLDSVKFGGH